MARTDVLQRIAMTLTRMHTPQAPVSLWLRTDTAPKPHSQTDYQSLPYGVKQCALRMPPNPL
jgi:hypothetical protein